MVRSRNSSLLPVLDGVLLLTMLVMGIVALVTLLDAVTSSTVGELSVALPTDQPGATLPAGVVVDYAEGVVTAETGLGERLAWWAVGPASTLVVLAGAYILRELVAAARAGDPFVTANVRRLRVLAALTIGYFLLTVVRSFVGVAIALDGLGLDGVTSTLSIAPVLSALVLFALAEIWQRGVDLRDEQQLTV